MILVKSACRWGENFSRTNLQKRPGVRILQNVFRTVPEHSAVREETVFIFFSSAIFGNYNVGKLYIFVIRFIPMRSSFSALVMLIVQPKGNTPLRKLYFA